MRKGRAEARSTSEKPIRRLASPAHLSALSKNPLAIALVVALLGNFLIPRILDRAETNRRALDLKANLATQMSGSFAAALTQGELFARDVVRKANVDPQAVFNDGLRDWRNASAEVDAQLAAYFAGALTALWEPYRKAVGAMYFLSGTGLKSGRCALIRDVAAVLDPGKLSPVTPSCGDLSLLNDEEHHLSLLNDEEHQKKICLDDAKEPYDLLAACDGNDQDVSGYQRGPTFYDAYTSVSLRLLDLGGSLIREMLSLTPSGF